MRVYVCVNANIYSLKIINTLTDVLRTQPYDLLTWSAAYFRCMANDIQPPAKHRFEENTDRMLEDRRLTKEYLKVLIKQVIS